ncbi:MAG: iron-sulfur cluster assembly accessory protein [Fimbriimonadia bacterium]|nr:iron-sulfur cluster assembly accessory protein [Fimbriimonadia bacterium]
MAITLSERAAKELQGLLLENGKPEAGLRIWVAGGGCSGLQYGMAIDEEQPEEHDMIFHSQGVKVYVDSMSLQYMDGSEVDFIEDTLGGGFKIENPMAVGGCGCGSSFQTEGSEGGGGCGSCSSAH